jgi:hypothetical protein
MTASHRTGASASSAVSVIIHIVIHHVVIHIIVVHHFWLVGRLVVASVRAIHAAIIVLELVVVVAVLHLVVVEIVVSFIN